MASNYGGAGLTIGHFKVGHVRVTSVTAAHALAPSLRLKLAWTLGNRSAKAGPPGEYVLVGVDGELFLGRGVQSVGALQQRGGRHLLRSLTYAQEQEDALTLDLDWYRFERLEEHRQGGTMNLWVQLVPRIEVDGTTTEAQVDDFPLSIPRDDWLDVVTSVTGDHTDVLEVRYHLSHAGRFGPSLGELAIAERAVDSGDFYKAVVQARKAVDLWAASVTTADSDVTSLLTDRVGDSHAELYAGLISRAKGMGNVKAHEPDAREYSRAEALFAVRFAKILIEMLAAVLGGSDVPRPPTT